MIHFSEIQLPEPANDAGSVILVEKPVFTEDGHLVLPKEGEGGILTLDEFCFRKDSKRIRINANSLTLPERKAYNSFLFNMQRSGLMQGKTRFVIPQKEFVEFWSGKLHKSQETLIELTHKLTTTGVQWLDENTGAWTNTTLLSSCSYNPLTREFKIELSDTLAEELRNPSTYGVISALVQKKFDSILKLTLYELSADMLIERQIVDYAIEDFYELTGIASGSTPKMVNHRRIAPAVEEVNAELIGYQLSVEAVSKQGGGRGRPRTTHFRLKIELDKDHLYANTRVPVDPEIVERLEALGIGWKAIEKLMTRHSPAILRQWIEKTQKEIEAKANSKTPVRNPAGWLLSALEQNWLLSQKEAATEQPPKQPARSKLAKEMEQNRQKNKELNERAFQQYLDCHDDEQVALTDEFYRRLLLQSNQTLIDLFREYHLDNTMIMKLFITFLIENKGFGNTLELG